MIDNFPELATNRLNLIEISSKHKVDIYNLFSNERVTQYYNLLPFKEETSAQRFIDWYHNRFEQNLAIRWGITLKNSSLIIGTIGFNNYTKNHRANIGYDLHPDYWNNGYITEALEPVIQFGFEKLEINRIEAEVMQGNIASEKVLEKAGFYREGILRDWMFWNEKHYDMTMFSRLK
ncbi:MAG: GNAT family N-acetyltransferase [Bacteroidota bacterium]